MIVSLPFLLIPLGIPWPAPYDGFGSSLAFPQPYGGGAGRLIVASSDGIHGFGGEPFRPTGTHRFQGRGIELQGRWTVKKGEDGPCGLPLHRPPSPPGGAAWNGVGEFGTGDLDEDGQGELFVGRGTLQSGGAGRVDVFSSRSQGPIGLRLRTLRRPR